MSNAELAKRWEDIQKRTFTKWVNSHLMKRSAKVENVQTDFQDGIRLIQLLEVIGGESIGEKYNMNPKMKIQKIENINKGLRYLGSKVRLVGQTAEHIHDGDLKMILGMIWIIILRFSIQDISEEELSAKEALLLWCQKRTKGHAHCDINNFHMSWQDGMAFCALIHAHRPDLIPYGDLDPSNPEANLKLAFDVAEKELGIPPLLDIEDIVGVPKPDERSVMTYVSQFYHAFSASRKNEVAGRRIGNLVDTTKQNDALKAQYDDKSRNLATWISTTTEKMQSRDFGNSIDSVKSAIGDMDTYKTEEKPPKAAEKLQLVALFNNIGAKLKSAGRPPFEPEVSVEATAGLWAGLNAAEQERYTALRAELAKQQQLAVLNRRFQNKAGQLEEWIAKKDNYLVTEEQVDSVAAAQTKITLLGAYSSEYERSEARLNTMNELAEKIISLEAANADEVKARSTAITESWKGLKDKEDAKRSDLQVKLEKQQEMERLRIQFANEGKDFTRFVKDTVSKVGASNFGDSLESVVAYEETMHAEDERITAAADQQRSSLSTVSQQLTELGVTDNKYSPLTDEDITTLHGQVGESLSRRHGTYAAEVARQEAMEAKRKEFAAAAEKFVANVAAAREAVKALEGEPQPLIQAVRAEYNDGSASAAEFQELQKLQDEMAQMGINDNKHTKYTLPMLEAQTRQLAKFVKDYIASLEKEHRLRGEYEERAAAVATWIDAMEPRLQFESDNTLEGVRSKKTEWTTYKTTERAQKNVEHLHVRDLYDQISSLLAANNRPAYAPPAALTVASLKEKEGKLDDQERVYEAAMAEELARQEKLDSLVSKYHAELDELHSFAEEKTRYLETKEKVDSLDTARLKLMHLDVFDKEHAGTQTRVAEARKLHDEIESLNYVDHPKIAEKHRGLQSRWEELTSKSSSKRAALEADRQVQQEKEDLRIAFADTAKTYAKFVKDNTESAEETNFGLTLEAVQAYKEELDQQDASILESSANQVQALEDLQQKLEEREVYDNKYTTISIAAVRTSSKQLHQALEQRQANYSAELKRQLAMDAKKREFAAAAASFIEWCDSRKVSIHALEGEPEALITAIGDAYKDGQPEEDRLAVIDALISEMSAMGITENRHTELNMPALRARAGQLGQDVKNMVSKLSTELDLKNKYVSDTTELGTWIRETHAKREGTVAPKQVTTVRSVTRTKMVPQKKTITVTESVPEKKTVTKVRKIPGVRKEKITRTVPVTRTVEKTVVVKKPATRTVTKRVKKTRLVPAGDASAVDEEATRAVEDTPVTEESAKKLKKSRSKSKVKGEIKRSKSKSKVKEADAIDDSKKKKKSKKDKKEDDGEDKKSKKEKKDKKDKKKKDEDVEEKKSKKKSKKEKKETVEAEDDSKPKKSKSKSRKDGKEKKDSKKDKKSRRKSRMPAMVEEEYETDEEVVEEYETDEEQVIVEEVSDTEEQEFEEEVAYEEEEEYEEEVEEMVEREVEKEIEEMVEEEYEEEVVETSFEEPTAEQTRQVFDNTLEGVRALRAEWNAYKTTAKAQKGVEKLNAAKLFHRIQEFLAANNRPVFEPHETPEDIEALWQKLEEGEKAYEAAIEDELARQEKLHSLSRSFNSEAQELDAWAASKLEYLDSEETVDTLDTARLKLMHLDVFDKEYAASHGRLGEVRELHDEIGRMNYVDHATVAEKHDALQSRWAQMQEKSVAKRAALEEAQKVQQAKEDLRIAFAEKAKAFVKFVKDNKERAGDTNFGLTLEAVRAFKAELDSQDEQISSSSTAQVQAIDDLQKQMEQCVITDNKHTTITKDDIVRNSEELTAALAQRQAAYAAELARQEAMEEKRKEFAAAASAFVSHLDERQIAIKALEGEPKELIAAVKSTYADGAAEKEKLGQLATLQDEMVKMGITENRHTTDNLASLGTKRDQLASFVKSYINTLIAEQELKEDYLSRTAALLAWIEGVSHDQEFDNTLEGARGHSTRWNEYKTTERAQKEIEKINLLDLFEKIRIVLKAGHQRPSFSPEGHTPEDINSAWDAMESADTEHESALESEIARQEKLASLTKSFKTEAEDIEKFLADKEAYLKSEEDVRSVDDSHMKIMHLDVFQEDYNSNQARVGHLEGLSREITQLGHKDADSVNADHERIAAAWKNLQDLAEAKRGTLEGAKGTEQEREAARLAFASKAAEYVQFVNDAKIHATDTNFGLTLDTVKAFKASLDEEERSVLEANDTHVAGLHDASKALTALNVSDNRHTSVTKDDIATHSADLKASLEQRQAAYSAELARQEAMEEKRKEFAGAASAFVAHLEERQTSIKALEGEPEPLISAVRAAYSDGAPEQEKLDSLSALQEDMTKMGITENPHTQHNLASLGTKRDQFAKFVKNYVSTLSDEKELKEEYLSRTAALLAWISGVVHDQDFDNTLEGARGHSTRWNEYKTTERAQKEIEKINLLELFEKISGVLKAGHQRPSFSPEGHTPEDINSAWAAMKKAEQDHESALESEISRQEQLDASHKGFNREADQVLSYIKEKREQLSAKEEVDSLDRAHMKLMHHGVMEEEVAANKARLNSLAAKLEALKEGNFHQASAAEQKHNAVLAAWKELEGLAESNRGALSAAKEHQQEREGLRLAFAEKAQAYDSFCKDSIYSVNEHQFGTSLEEVEAYRTTLDEDTAAMKSKGAELKAAVEAAAAALEDADVDDNKHTTLTVEDMEASAAELDAALAARESAYNEELERLQGNDKECQKFAEVAEEFVAWIQSHKSALESVACDAPPVERKAAVDELYSSGTEADNRLAAVEEVAKSLQERGVFYNPKTTYTLHALRSIRKNLSDAVSNLLASIDEEHQLLTRGEALKQELAQKEQLDRQYIEFETKFQELEMFLDAQLELLTETISPDSVKEVEELQDACSQAIAAVASKESEISELNKSGEELSAAGVAVSAEPLVAKHQLATAKGTDRTSALAEEHKRQVANDALCKEFADLAESLDGFLQVEAQVLASLDGEPEAQLEAVRERRQELSGKMQSVQHLSELNDKMVDAEITTNSYSDLTYQAIRAQAEELENSQQDKEKLLEREIYLKNNSGVSAEQLDEFKEVFNYFDKNNRGVLSELEFKSVLQSLGEDPSDAELKTFMAELATEEGVPFDNFVSHMVARATDSNTEDEVLSAFRELANYKDFITEAEMRAAMDGEKVDYLISVMPKTDEGYDYATWAKQAYSR